MTCTKSSNNPPNGYYISFEDDELTIISFQQRKRAVILPAYRSKCQKAQRRRVCEGKEEGSFRSSPRTSNKKLQPVGVWAFRKRVILRWGSNDYSIEDIVNMLWWCLETKLKCKFASVAIVVILEAETLNNMPQWICETTTTRKITWYSKYITMY